MDRYKTPCQCKDKDELNDWMKGNVDKRKVFKKNSFEELKKESDYRYKTLKDKPLISAPQFELLNKLSSLVTYRNIIIEKREDLADKLNTSKSNLNRKLKLIQEFILIETEKDNKNPTHKGWVRVLINPNYVYKSRLQPNVRSWYLEHIKQSIGITTYKEHIEFLMKPELYNKVWQEVKPVEFTDQMLYWLGEFKPDKEIREDNGCLNSYSYENDH